MKHEKMDQTTEIIETIQIENLDFNSTKEINLEPNGVLSTPTTTSILKFARTTNDYPAAMAIILPQ